MQRRMKARKTLEFIWILLMLPMATHSQDSVGVESLEVKTECPVVKLKAVRLPDLQIPRAGHHSFCIDGELLVMGGHTTGFVPTPTAEYYNDGEWHTIPMTYSHDQGFSLQLSSGKVMIGGGHELPLGIGQTFSVEFYDPKTHCFSDFGCLDIKRCFADAVELMDGRIAITGNWYHRDGVDCYDGRRVFVPQDSLRVPRSCPYVFRTAEDDAFIFSNLDNYGKIQDSIIVESLRGIIIDVPLFRQWHPYQPHPSVFRSADSFIGDICQKNYTYLLPVENDEGELAIAKLTCHPKREASDTDRCVMSLLPTVAPVPRHLPWSDISYLSHILADRNAGRAYLLGHDEHRLYILSIGYAQAADGQPAPLTLFYTDSLDVIGYPTAPVLTSEGDLVVMGGIAPDNFTPTRDRKSVV